MTTVADLRRSLLDRGVTRTYSIAFTPRCGSTALTHLLTNAGLGNPTEYFQYPLDNSAYWNWLPGSTIAGRFVELVTSYQGGGIFGSKVTHDHRAHLEGCLEIELGVSVNLDEILPDHHWLYMYRRDLIDQAISAHVARSSGIWHVKSGTPAPVDLATEYDFLAILAQVHLALIGQFHWDTYFKARGIDPLRIAYEDFVAGTDDMLAAIQAHLGLQPSNSDPLPTADRIPVPERMSSLWPQPYSDLKGRFMQDLMDWGKDSLWEKYGSSLERWGSIFTDRGWK